jgi:hypothetical protein
LPGQNTIRDFCADSIKCNFDEWPNCLRLRPISLIPVMILRFSACATGLLLAAHSGRLRRLTPKNPPRALFANKAGLAFHFSDAIGAPIGTQPPAGDGTLRLWLPSNRRRRCTGRSGAARACRHPDGTSIPIGVKRRLAIRRAAVTETPKSRDRRPPSPPTQ